mmetsp:Transcript_11560/g.25917  ORF Transcript_11560/g.25917 Transcript_11560/m.25917 type:complete len:90 (+) Transcript_11560:905-1174(+)
MESLPNPGQITTGVLIVAGEALVVGAALLLSVASGLKLNAWAPPLLAETPISKRAATDDKRCVILLWERCTVRNKTTLSDRASVGRHHT